MKESSYYHRNVEISQTAGCFFAAALTAVFFAVQLVNILHHGMWRDEMQVWSLCQHSHSLLQLVYLKRYEGHPDLWYVLVFLVSRVFPHPVGMQLLNLAIATAVTYLISRYSPFARYQKVLIVFGYFLFYEYSAISREYEIGILALFAFCAAFRPGPKKNYIVLAILLSLMAESNIYALILSVCLALMMLVEAFQSQKPQEFLFPRAAYMAGSIILFALAVSASLFEIRLPSGAGWDPTADIVGHARANYLPGMEMIWKAFVPIPKTGTLHFWNTNLL